MKVEKGFEIKNIDIFNLNGKLVKNDLPINKTRIDVSDLANGMYIITIRLRSGKTHSKKILVKN